MKKLSFIIILILILTLAVLCFSACIETPDNKPDDTDPDLTPNPAPTPDPKPDPKPEEEKYTKVIILSGQSNMVGFSNRNLLINKIDAGRAQKLKKGFTNIKLLGETGNGATKYDSISMESFINVTLGGGGTMSYYEDSFGPEVGLAETLSAAFPDENVYIIKCAFGGSSLFETWQSPSMAEHESYCYKLLTDLIDAGLNALKDANLNPKIAAFCWMQGESDADSDEHYTRYLVNLRNFVTDLRTAYDKDSLNGKMNFVDAYIHDYFKHYANVNKQKARFAEIGDNNYLIDTMKPDLVIQGINGLTARQEPSVGMGETIDPLHYDSTSMLMLGNMYADQICKILKHNGAN